MRNSEPTLSVSCAGSMSEQGQTGANFTRACLLTREESLYRPPVARGYRPGVGWCYGVMTSLGPVFGTLERVTFFANWEWARIQAAHGADIARDFSMVDAIDRAWTERLVELGHKGHGWS